MIEDDGYFQQFPSQDSLCQAIEYSDEVSMVFDEAGKVYTVVGQPGMSISLEATPQALDTDQLAIQWVEHVDKRGFDVQFRRKLSRGPQLVADIFEVLSFPDGPSQPGSWVVESRTRTHSFGDSKSVDEFCSKLTPGDRQDTQVIDPYGHRYRPIGSPTGHRRKAHFLLYQEI
ncbi:hypothetical protein [Arthrobacter sp. KK5.5]|uniref:hypothetical protein n=1 Tax=Arthrobacter sp. KK5.5 TaxID=3373084 RepID=UPI003EE77A04